MRCTALLILAGWADAQAPRFLSPAGLPPAKGCGLLQGGENFGRQAR
jgi:hypothetical protein